MNRNLYKDENYIVSEEFGRTFWLDTDNELKSAPTLIKGGYDKDQSDYVSEWTEWEGVNYSKLFEIVRHLTIKKHFEVKHG
tara:strand:- start:23 stop:265 length:243 start_codon:yes stop_codon:yes gene_type:complete